MTESNHWVVFPYLAFSHMIPTLELCYNLIKIKGIHITVVLDSGLIEKLKKDKLIPQALLQSNPGIEFHPIPTFEKVDDEEIDGDKFIEINMNHAHEAVKTINSNRKITSILLEMYGTFCHKQVLGFNIPHYVYFTTNSFATYFRVVQHVHPQLIQNQPELPENITKEFAEKVLGDLNLLYWVQMRFRGGVPTTPANLKHFYFNNENTNIVAAMKNAKAVIFNSFSAFDTENKDLLFKDTSFNTKYVHVGPVSLYNTSPKLRDSDDHPIIKWLNGQKKNSVLYIAFGSVFKVKNQEIPQIAEALLQLDIPFIWALKKDQQEYLPEKVRSCILQENTEIPLTRKGIITSWAPQVGILKNPAVAAFVSHVGWNSFLEAISGGVPLIAWPIFAEQLINGMMILTKGMGVLMQNTGLFSKKVLQTPEIIETIRQVLPADGSSPYKAKMEYFQQKLWEAIQPNGESYKELESL
ncbi:hypothetical protein HK103_006352 [Boothiomyces macroporosus]|uniref:Glycosyltransferase n=1 Tax=Boothiomyces macroporosus TaxID=261099 RepID=A0AAD5UDL8_9FUNG|nr:hypothetical protein HK103_006352 [Boothiomyces macroporosus]